MSSFWGRAPSVESYSYKLAILSPDLSRKQLSANICLEWNELGCHLCSMFFILRPVGGRALHELRKCVIGHSKASFVHKKNCIFLMTYGFVDFVVCAFLVY